MKKTLKFVSAATAWTIGTVLFSLVFVAGGLSLYINVAVGLQMGVVAAIMLGLGDVAKMVLPITMHAVGKTVLLRSLYWLVVVASFACAFYATADMFGAKFVTDMTSKKVETIGATQLADLRASLATAREMAREESKKKGCGPKCEKLNARVESLEKEIKAQVAKQETNTTDDMSGKAVLAQSMFGISGQKVDTGTAISLVVFQMMMMELLSMLSSSACRMIGYAYGLGKARRKAAKQQVARAAKRAAEKAEKIAALEEAKLAREAAAIEAKKNLAVRRRRMTLKKKQDAVEKMDAEKQAKKQAALEKRRATLAAKKAAIAANPELAAAKPKRQWSEKRIQAHQAKRAYLKVVA